MSVQKKNQNLPQTITTQLIRNMVSNILRHEHRYDPSPIKGIGAATGFNLYTIAKWYHAKNAPQSRHLLILSYIYPAILNGILDIVEYKKPSPSWLCSSGANIRVSQCSQKRVLDFCYPDNFVHIDVKLTIDIMRKLNHRQLWFISEITKGRRVGARELSYMWQNSKRTSRRDINKLIEFGIVQFQGSNNNGYYSLGAKMLGIKALR